MRIREYRPTDLPYLYDICLRTGDSGRDASALLPDPFVLGQYYAAPYAARNPRCVLILEGDRGSDGVVRPVGYILGTDDTAAYNGWLAAEWLPAAAELYAPAAAPPGENDDLYARLAGLFRELPTAPACCGRYPGHIHIDILPEGQGTGWGRRLMDAFSERLRSLGCPGFHLGVGAKNGGGIAFYRRYGMEELEAPDWGFVFGKRLL